MANESVDAISVDINGDSNGRNGAVMVVTL